MIPKNEHTSTPIPPNVATLLETLNQQLLLIPTRLSTASPLGQHHQNQSGNPKK